MIEIHECSNGFLVTTTTEARRFDTRQSWIAVDADQLCDVIREIVRQIGTGEREGQG